MKALTALMALLSILSPASFDAAPAVVVAWGLSGGDVRPSRSFPNDDTSLVQAFDLALSMAG